jgi:hypothetical protein
MSRVEQTPDKARCNGEASLEADVERVGQLDALGWRKPCSSGMAHGIFSSGARR